MIKITDFNKVNKSFVKKGKIKEQGNDFLFWSSQPYEIRLKAIEQIRKEYNTWKYGAKQRFQRVYKIIKRQPS